MKKGKNCKNCSEKCNDCAARQAKEFEMEVDEEIQQERLTAFWKKYSWLIYSLVILVLASVVGFESYNTWRTKTRLKESDLFEEATLALLSGQTQKAITDFGELSQNGKTGYRILAQFELADIQMREDNRKEALDTLKTAVETTKDSDPLHHIALLSYVGYQLDEGNPDELIQILTPTLNNPYFQGMATELTAILLKKQNKQDEAKQLIQKALDNPNTTSDTASRLNHLLGE